MNTSTFAKNYLRAKKERTKRDCKKSLIRFACHTMPEYVPNWHHDSYAGVLDRFIAGEIQYLIISMPPQHGKSELATRRMPAKILGDNPNTKIAVCGYNHTLASNFNRDVQRIIETEEYAQIYPDTQLSSSNVRTAGNWLKNSDMFEVVNKKGSLKSVGIGGALTGSQVDVMLIDDPIKDRVEAYSNAYQERVWGWWETVAQTRLHNQSKVCIVMTRWHEKDLVGRLLASQPGKWTVVNYEAIKTGEPTEIDPREYGAALWPERQSLERLMAIESQSPITFSALYQGRPTAESGNIVDPSWFEIIRPSEFTPDLMSSTRYFVIDGAYTKKQENDPSGIMCFSVVRNNLYIWHVETVRKGFPQFIKFVVEYVSKHGYTRKSIILVEPKATGISVVQQIKHESDLNIKQHKMIEGDKIARLNHILPRLESGRVFLIQGNWNQPFIQQCKNFPRAAHDEEIDMLVMAVVEGLERRKKRRPRTGTV